VSSDLAYFKALPGLSPEELRRIASKVGHCSRYRDRDSNGERHCHEGRSANYKTYVMCVHVAVTEIGVCVLY
jgi:hypothetical protein